MELEMNIQEISEKAKGFQLDEATKNALQLLKEMKLKGFIQKQEYTIATIDTIGKRYYFLNNSRAMAQKYGL